LVYKCAVTQYAELLDQSLARW